MTNYFQNKGVLIVKNTVNSFLFNSCTQKNDKYGSSDIYIYIHFHLLYYINTNLLIIIISLAGLNYFGFLIIFTGDYFDDHYKDRIQGVSKFDKINKVAKNL